MSAPVRHAVMGPPIRSIPVLLRIDGRRAASWLTLFVAAGSLPCLASLGTAAGWPAPIVALLVGAVLAVAAVGDLPIDACRQPPADHFLAPVWLCERAAWPVAGLLSAAAAWSVVHGPAGPCRTILAASLAGAAAGCASLHLLRRGGANAADSASLTIVMAVAAAWAGWPAGGIAPGFWNLAAALATWGGIGLVVRAIDRRWGSGWEWLPEVDRQPRRLRKLLTGAAMAAGLSGMVGWLFLDPSRAAFFPVMALAFYVALAVPEATLGDGVSDTIGWRRLHATAAGPDATRLALRPGCFRKAVAATVSNGAILGWPPLVAAVLLVGRGQTARDAAFAVFGLAIAAAAVTAIAWAGDRFRAAADAAHAAAIAVAVVLALCFVISCANGTAKPAGRPACPDCPRPAGAIPRGGENGGLVTLRKWRVPATLRLHPGCTELG